MKYKEFITGGSFNKIYNLDDDWILKMPFKVGEGMPDNDYPHPYETMKEVLIEFSDHINMMKKYPEIFPKVKKLDRYRAAIEKCDIKRANEELFYIKSILNFESGNIIENLFMDENLLQRLKLKGETDSICLNWYNFMLKIINWLNMDPMSGMKGYKNDIDLHDNNVGIDKKGNIKLVDF